MTDKREANATDALETDNFIETYQIIAEWIRFADAKAAAVLTVAGAFAGFLLPTLEPFLQRAKEAHSSPIFSAIGMALFGGWLVLWIFAGVYAFRCILPFRHKGKHPAIDLCTHFHPAAVSAKYKVDTSDAFIADCQELGTEGLKREVLTAILIDSHISGAKYASVTLSIRLLAVSGMFGFAYLFFIQF